MPIEFFRNDMMNKLFLPVVGMGSVALTAVVVTTVDWAGVKDAIPDIDIPDIPSLPGGSDDVPSISSGSFDEEEYEDMGGLGTDGISDEDLTTITSGTTAVVRCTGGGTAGYFMEFGFNDDEDSWTYAIMPQYGTAPVKLMSDFSYISDFVFIKENFGFQHGAGSYIWQDQTEADLQIYGGNDDGTVSWDEWKDYMITVKAVEQGYLDCDKYVVGQVTTEPEPEETVDDPGVVDSGGIPTSVIIGLSIVGLIGAAGIVYKIKF